MNTTRIGCALSSLLLLLLLSLPLAAAPAELRQFPSGQVLTPPQLPAAICRGWVEVQTAAPAQIVFWDILLEVERDSRILIGCNQDYLYALALAGRFDNGHEVVSCGMVSLWQHFGGEENSPAVHPFSPRRLAGLFAATGYPGDPGLEALAHSQQPDAQTLIPTGGQALPATPGDRPFRTLPEIMAIKRASRDLSDYGLRTATQFAKALSECDPGLLAALLSPALFQEETSSVSSSIHPSPARFAFAERLIASYAVDDPAAPSSALRDLGNFRYEMHSSERTFRLSLHLMEGSLFVKRLDAEPGER